MPVGNHPVQTDLVQVGRFEFQHFVDAFARDLRESFSRGVVFVRVYRLLTISAALRTSSGVPSVRPNLVSMSCSQNLSSRSNTSK